MFTNRVCKKELNKIKKELLKGFELKSPVYLTYLDIQH